MRRRAPRRKSVVRKDIRTRTLFSIAALALIAGAQGQKVPNGRVEHPFFLKGNDIWFAGNIMSESKK